MRFSCILSFAALPVSAHCIKPTELSNHVYERNVKDHFRKAVSKKLGPRFIKYLLTGGEYKLLEILGEDAYEHITTCRSNVKRLSNVEGRKLFRDFFLKSHPVDRETIVEHLVVLKAFSVLKDFGEDAYQYIAASEDSVKTLVEANDLELFKGFFFESRPRDRQRIVGHLIALKAFDILRDIGKDAYRCIWIRKKSVRSFVKANDPELFKDFFFKSHPRDRETITKYLLTLKAFDILKDMGKDAYQSIWISEESVRSLTKANDLDLFKSFFDGLLPYEREEVVEYLIILEAVHILKDIGEDVVDHLPLKKRSVQVLVKMKDSDSLKRFYEKLSHFKARDLLSKGQCTQSPKN